MREWLLVYSKPRHEIKLSSRLLDMGIEAFCPTRHIVKQWSDRKKKVEEPLFTSYVFVKLDASERHLIFHVPGFSRFVFWLGKPVIVREKEIIAIKNFLNKVVHDSIVLEQFSIGQSVQVQMGPLKSLEGKLLTIKNQQATLLIETLGTLVRANVALADLVK